MAASLRLTEEGKNYLNSGNLIKASELFEKGITISPSNPYAYFFMARLRFERRGAQTVPRPVVKGRDAL